MPEPLQDVRGCLTPAGLRAVHEAPPGRAPGEIAAHLAGCARCQSRLLAAGRASDAGLGERLKTLRVLGWLILGGSLLAGAALVVLTMARR